MTVLLQIGPVRGQASRAGEADRVHRRLWSDLTRRAEPTLVTAPACLLAITAYLAGDGPLARRAVDRALDADPVDRQAHLIDQTLKAGASPQFLRALLGGTLAT